MESRSTATVLFSCFAAVCFGLSGCTTVRDLIFGPPEPQSEVADYIHEVRFSGETLSLIAYWHTGQAERWREIQLHNPTLETNKIRIGDAIVIPGRLVTRYSPLPAALVARLRVSTDTNPLYPAPHYRFRVNSIAGCEDLGNSFFGLEACAGRLERLQQNNRRVQVN
jgi:hypothetical protein